MNRQGTSTAFFIIPWGERKLRREIAIDYSLLIMLLLFDVTIGFNLFA